MSSLLLFDDSLSVMNSIIHVKKLGKTNESVGSKRINLLSKLETKAESESNGVLLIRLSAIFFSLQQQAEIPGVIRENVLKTGRNFLTPSHGLADHVLTFP